MKEKANPFFVSCEEANHSCDRNQYKEASLLEMIKLNLHLIYCKACREYTKNNNKLTKLIKSPEVEAINQSEKELLRAEFEKELLK